MMRFGGRGIGRRDFLCCSDGEERAWVRSFIQLYDQYEPASLSVLLPCLYKPALCKVAAYQISLIGALLPRKGNMPKCDILLIALISDT